MAHTRRQFLQLTAGALAFAMLPGCGDEGAQPPRRGEPFPQVVLPDLHGHDRPFPKNTALVVNFWATWCAPCRREMPSLQRLSTYYRPQDLQVIGISVDDDVNLVREFQLRYGIAFTLLSDQEQRLTSARLHVATLPMTFLLTREHVIADVVAGARDWADDRMVQQIDRMLDLRGAASRK